MPSRSGRVLLLAASLLVVARSRDATDFVVSTYSALHDELGGGSTPGPAGSSIRSIRSSSYLDLLGAAVTVRHDATTAPGVLALDRDPNVLAVVCSGATVYLRVRRVEVAEARLARAAAQRAAILSVASGWGCTSTERVGEGDLLPAPGDAGTPPAAPGAFFAGDSLFRRVLSVAPADAPAASPGNGAWLALLTAHASLYDAFAHMDMSFSRVRGAHEHRVLALLRGDASAGDGLPAEERARVLLGLSQASSRVRALDAALPPAREGARSALDHGVAALCARLLHGRGGDAFAAVSRGLASAYSTPSPPSVVPPSGGFSVLTPAQLVELAEWVTQVLLTGSVSETIDIGTLFNWNSDRSVCVGQPIDKCSKANEPYIALDRLGIVECEDCWAYAGVSALLETAFHWEPADFFTFLPVLDLFAVSLDAAVEASFSANVLLPKDVRVQSGPPLAAINLYPSNGKYADVYRGVFVIATIPLDFLIQARLQAGVSVDFRLTTGVVIGPGLWFQETWNMGIKYTPLGGWQTHAALTQYANYRKPRFDIVGASLGVAASLSVGLRLNLYNVWPIDITITPWVEVQLAYDSPEDKCPYGTGTLSAFAGVTGWIRINEATILGFGTVPTGGVLPLNLPLSIVPATQLVAAGLFGCTGVYLDVLPGFDAANMTWSAWRAANNSRRRLGGGEHHLSLPRTQPSSVAARGLALGDDDNDDAAPPQHSGGRTCRNSPCADAAACCASAPVCYFGTCQPKLRSDESDACSARWFAGAWPITACDATGLRMRVVRCQCADGSVAADRGAQCDPAVAPSYVQVCDAAAVAAAAAAIVDHPDVVSLGSPWRYTSPSADTVDIFHVPTRASDAGLLVAVAAQDGDPDVYFARWDPTALPSPINSIASGTRIGATESVVVMAPVLWPGTKHTIAIIGSKEYEVVVAPVRVVLPTVVATGTVAAGGSAWFYLDPPSGAFNVRLGARALSAANGDVSVCVVAGNVPPAATVLRNAGCTWASAAAVPYASPQSHAIIIDATDPAFTPGTRLWVGVFAVGDVGDVTVTAVPERLLSSSFSTVSVTGRKTTLRGLFTSSAGRAPHTVFDASGAVVADAVSGYNGVAVAVAAPSDPLPAWPDVIYDSFFVRAMPSAAAAGLAAVAVAVFSEATALFAAATTGTTPPAADASASNIACPEVPARVDVPYGSAASPIILSVTAYNGFEGSTLVQRFTEAAHDAECPSPAAGARALMTPWHHVLLTSPAEAGGFAPAAVPLGGVLGKPAGARILSSLAARTLLAARSGRAVVAATASSSRFGSSRATQASAERVPEALVPVSIGAVRVAQPSDTYGVALTPAAGLPPFSNESVSTVAVYALGKAGGFLTDSWTLLQPVCGDLDDPSSSSLPCTNVSLASAPNYAAPVFIALYLPPSTAVAVTVSSRTYANAAAAAQQPGVSYERKPVLVVSSPNTPADASSRSNAGVVDAVGSEVSVLSANCDPFVSRPLYLTLAVDGEPGPVTVSTLSLRLNSIAPQAASECLPVAYVVTPWELPASPCGRGIATRTVMCVTAFDAEPVDDALCAVYGLVPPEATIVVDSGACAYTPEANWGPCSATCGEGIATRAARCFNADDRQVNASWCANATLPPLTRPCVAASSCVVDTGSPVAALRRLSWNTSAWSPCSAPCAGGIRVRNVLCAAGDSVVDAAVCIAAGLSLARAPPALEVCATDPCPAFFVDVSAYSARTLALGGALTGQPLPPGATAFFSVHLRQPSPGGATAFFSTLTPSDFAGASLASSFPTLAALRAPPASSATAFCVAAAAMPAPLLAVGCSVPQLEAAAECVAAWRACAQNRSLAPGALDVGVSAPPPATPPCACYERALSCLANYTCDAGVTGRVAALAARCAADYAPQQRGCACAVLAPPAPTPSAVALFLNDVALGAPPAFTPPVSATEAAFVAQSTADTPFARLAPGAATATSLLVYDGDSSGFAASRTERFEVGVSAVGLGAQRYAIGAVVLPGTPFTLEGSLASPTPNAAVVTDEALVAGGATLTVCVAQCVSLAPPSAGGVAAINAFFSGLTAVTSNAGPHSWAAYAAPTLAAWPTPLVVATPGREGSCVTATLPPLPEFASPLDEELHLVVPGAYTSSLQTLSVPPAAFVLTITSSQVQCVVSPWGPWTLLSTATGSSARPGQLCSVATYVRTRTVMQAPSGPNVDACPELIERDTQSSCDACVGTPALVNGGFCVDFSGLALPVEVATEGVVLRRSLVADVSSLTALITCPPLYTGLGCATPVAGKVRSYYASDFSTCSASPSSATAVRTRATGCRNARGMLRDAESCNNFGLVAPNNTVECGEAGGVVVEVLLELAASVVGGTDAFAAADGALPVVFRDRVLNPFFAGRVAAAGYAGCPGAPAVLLVSVRPNATSGTVTVVLGLPAPCSAATGVPFTAADAGSLRALLLNTVLAAFTDPESFARAGVGAGFFSFAAGGLLPGTVVTARATTVAGVTLFEESVQQRPLAPAPDTPPPRISAGSGGTRTVSALPEWPVIVGGVVGGGGLLLLGIALVVVSSRRASTSAPSAAAGASGDAPMAIAKEAIYAAP